MTKECVIGNIGEKEKARLRRAGLVGLVCGVALAATAILYQAPWWVHATLFISLWAGLSALLQAKEQTSILLAARRLRRIDGREEPERYVLEFRGRARTIQRRSLLVAVFLTVLVTLLG